MADTNRNAKVEVIVKFSIDNMGTVEEIQRDANECQGGDIGKFIKYEILENEGIYGVADEQYDILDILVDGKSVYRGDV